LKNLPTWLLIHILSLSGIQAISIPVKLSKNNLPLSIQLIAQSFEEEKLLNAANWLEKEVEFPHLTKLDSE
jgi:aspartyl-tRNA(Asn)/glutamyl-tRNA(Gln) amidotransferase subunit A